jgi:hypothetical protein
MLHSEADVNSLNEAIERLQALGHPFPKRTLAHIEILKDRLHYIEHGGGYGGCLDHVSERDIDEYIAERPYYIEEQSLTSDKADGEGAKFKLGQNVAYKGKEYPILDIDEGYELLALGGNKYICPNHEENDCIEAPMRECSISHC